MDWRRYSARAHTARRRLPRYEHPVVVTLAASAVFTIAAVLLLQVVGIGLSAGIADLGRSVAGALPSSEEENLQIAEPQFSVSAAPIFEALPEFTKSNEIHVLGRVPTFAVRPERRVLILVDREAVTVAGIGEDGRFGPLALTLPDGTSTITAVLSDGGADIASTSATVVVDRTPPQIALVRPKNGDTVAGPDVIVEGRTEPGAEVTVNERTLLPNPDGTFTDRIVAAPGALKLAIVARDKAGNETRTELAVTVGESTVAPIGGVRLFITLDRIRVRPGETVVADVVALDGGTPRANLSVTLQVGVTTIGTYRTDQSGHARIGFAAPNHEVENVSVVILGGGTSATASLTVSKE